MRADTAGTDWRSLGQCLDEDPELFFPVGSAGPAVLQVTQAKAVCQTCRVQEQCLKWALEQGLDQGVRGGLDGDERRALRGLAA